MRFIIVLSSSVFLEASRDTLGNHAGVPPPSYTLNFRQKKKTNVGDDTMQQIDGDEPRLDA